MREFEQMPPDLLALHKKKFNKLKRVRAILLVVSLAGITLASVFFIQKQIERQKRIITEGKLETTIEAKKVVENNLTARTKQWEGERAKAQVLTEKLDNEIRRRQQIAAKLDKIAQQLAQEQRHRGGLEQEVKETEEKLTLAIKAKAEIEAKYKELQTNSIGVIELEKIVVTARPPLEGRVVLINREQEFILVDLGSKDKLEIGEVLAVYRNNDLIGRARIVEVRETLSAATILHELRWNEISEDDIVKLF
ncbi:MAG: hypothetical protein ABIE75_05190 [Candidatus Omnitrophota bacterium]